MPRGKKYEDYRWGQPPPSKRQFGYAVSLGVPVKEGMNRFQLSEAIDDVVAAKSPATREQLRAVARLGGILPRKISQAEAEAVLDVLECDILLECRGCRASVAPHDLRCSMCGAKQPRHKFRIAFDHKGRPCVKKPRGSFRIAVLLLILLGLLWLVRWLNVGVA